MESTIVFGFKSVQRRPFGYAVYENKGPQWIRKSKIGNYYLSGFFGGVQFKFSDALYFSAEYDSQYFNLGAGVVLIKKIGLQVYLLDIEEFSGSFSYKVFLDKPKKFIPKS